MSVLGRGRIDRCNACKRVAYCRNKEAAMKLRKWILLAVAALLAGSVAVAEARGGGGGGGGGGMGGGGWHGGGGGSGGGGWHGGGGGDGWHGGHDGHSHGSVAFFWG